MKDLEGQVFLSQKETSNHLTRKEKAEKILEAIPCDRWVSAAEITAETALGSVEVSGLIRRKLLNKQVERKLSGTSGRERYLYRRLRCLNKIQG